ncbi:MAG: DsbC family protein [Nevskia sp.]|nr:DsbC family protein [Nevskia sp.]
MNKLFVLWAALTCSAAALAADAAGDDAIKDKIAKALHVTPADIRPSAAPGLYEVQKGHEFGYATADGKFFIAGDLVNLETGQQITEQHRRADRLAALRELGEDNMIVFAPTPPIATKYVVAVFTDIDCPYCRKLHSQIAQYNAKGIEIRYVFFPRTGLNTPSYYKAESVWCAADRQAALTLAKRGQTIPEKKCVNPVAREYQLGLDLGVHATPMLILPNGDELPGYVPPDDLAAELARSAAEDKTAAVSESPHG